MTTVTPEPRDDGALEVALPTFAATIRDHPKAIVVASIVAVTGAIGAFATFQSLVEFTRTLFEGHVVAAESTIDAIAAASVVLLILLQAAIAGAMITFAHLYKRHGEKIRAAALGRLTAMRARVADAERHTQYASVVAEQTALIANRLHPKTGDMIGKVSEVEYTLTVDHTGGATVTRVDHLRADKVAVLRTVHTISADDRATPMPLLADIGFEIKDRRSDTAIAYLPLKDLPREKEIALFYLPYIESTENEPRIATSRYYWPGMMLRLVEDGDDEWGWDLLSIEPVKQFTARFFFHPALGETKCDLLGPNRGPYTIKPAESNSGWRGWAFEMANAPAVSSQYRFRIRRALNRA